MGADIYDGRHIEICQHVPCRYPNDIRKWPPANQLLARAALVLFLKEHSGVAVVSEHSRCLDASEPRFEPGVRPDGTRLEFGLHFIVELDREVRNDG